LHRYPVAGLLYVALSRTPAKERCMSDENLQESNDRDERETAASEETRTEELADEALENVSGGYATFKNETSPWGDVG
jgi:hypothetical protein